MTAMPTSPDRLILQRLRTPIGEALVLVDEQGVLRALDWEDHEARMRRLVLRHYGALPIVEGSAPRPVTAAISAYFAGELDAIRSLAWRTGGTAFQRAVWRGLCEIPVGTTLSYKALAEKIGAPAAVRAVGLANGANPVGVVVPCHRVIGAAGALTGYGGGLERKAWLLSHEGAAFRPARAA
jgi:methylated-DNA-[protein]-cysteine S-methyltransferase